MQEPTVSETAPGIVSVTPLSAAQAAAEKQKYGPYPATNRHERRKAAKLMRQDAKRMHVH
jgi:hypothetical protein